MTKVKNMELRENTRTAYIHKQTKKRQKYKQVGKHNKAMTFRYGSPVYQTNKLVSLLAGVGFE